MKIQGSKAIFVGGASGMCRATAERFKSRGGEIAILDLPSSAGAEVAAAVAAAATGAPTQRSPRAP